MYRLYKPLLTQKESEALMYIRDANIDYIVPVPSERRRILFRGNDHTLSIAMYLSQMSTIPTLRALIRKGKSKRQALLRRSERLHAQTGHFILSPHVDIKGTHVLLVDDITTTGSTLAETKKVLLAGGASFVYTLTIAH